MDAGFGVGERPQSVERLGGGQRGLQGTPGRGPFINGKGERGLQQKGLHQGVREQRGHGSVEDGLQDRPRGPGPVGCGLGPRAHEQ
jgi:hypothetical protein